MSVQSVNIFVLILLFGLMQAHSAFREHFHGSQNYIRHIHQLEGQLAEERFRYELTRSQFAEFKQDLSLVLPAVLKNTKPDSEASYPLRNLASVAALGAPNELVTLSSRAQFEVARGSFRQGQFDRAVRELNIFVNKFNYSPHIAEAYFLLVEAQFQLQNYEDSLRFAERMVDLFPESELTGFALLRMGRVMEKQDRPEEAVEIYRTVVKSFAYPDLNVQAKTLLQSVKI
jgi:TolA-binding protein